MAIFSGPYLKLARANRHIAKLEEVLAPYLSDEPVEYSNFQAEAKGPGSWKVGVSTHYKALPEMVPAILGDIVHNVRSALDLMSSELAALRGENPDNVYFPFASHQGDLDLMIKRRKFDKIGSDAVALLKTLQPYTGGNLLLRAIHDLDLIDKHRGLIPQPRPRHTLFIIPLPKKDEESQTVYEPPHLPTDRSVELMFPPESGLGDRPIVQTLKDMVQLCEGILEDFARLQLS